MSKPVPPTADNYNEARKQILTSNYRKFKLAPGDQGETQVWIAVMEVGFPQTVVTLVCMIDGTVQLFFGHGASVTDGGRHPAVLSRAREFIEAAQSTLKKLNPTQNFPLPEIDRVRFYVRTFEDSYTTQANRHIDKEDHELFPLFRSGHEVIAALRQVQESADNSPQDNPDPA